MNPKFKHQHILLMLFLIALPLNRILTFDLGFINLSLSEALTIFGFLNTLKDGSFYNYFFKEHSRVNTYIFLFFIFSVFSFLNISDASIGIRFLFSVSMKFMLVFFIGQVIYNSDQKDKYLKLYAFLIFCSSLIALLQISVTTGSYEGNITGTFKFRNEYIYYALPCTLLWLYFYLVEKKNIYLFYYFIMFASILLSRGRAGLLILVISSIAMIVIKYKTRVGRIFLLFISFIAIGLLVINFLPNTITDELYYRYFEAYALEQEGETGSSFVREILIRNGIDKFLQSPIIGYGAGDFFTVSAGFTELRAFDLPYLQPHNSYLGMIVEIGAIGLLSFLGICYESLKKKGIKNINSQTDFSVFRITVVAVLLNLLSFDGAFREGLWVLLPFALIKGNYKIKINEK